MSSEGDADGLSPAEDRLLQHLEALRDDAPEPGAPLAAAVIRRARWQGTVRPFAQSAGILIGAMGDCVRIMAGRTAP
ncbi:MAG: hypothetical protein ACJ77Z_02440 [Thermoleophilaceae bacterium]|jgi:type VI protein secretion system component VasF